MVWDPPTQSISLQNVPCNPNKKLQRIPIQKKITMKAAQGVLLAR